MTTACTAPADELARFPDLERRSPASLGALFADRVATTPDTEAYRRPDGAGGWRSQTWAETGRVAGEIAAGLLALGVAREDRVAIMASTRVEWIEVDLGIMCAGAATTTVYPTSTVDEVVHILADSGSRVAVVENTGHLDAVLAAGSPVDRVVLVDGPAPSTMDRVTTLAALRERGRDLLAAAPTAVTDATAAVRPDDLATLIYTSGTTGRSKGVRLPHRSWLYQALATQATGLAGPDDVGYLWLPMAHSFGKGLLAAQIAVGHAAVVDGDVSRIITNLPVVRPTLMPSVPRVFEKVHAGVVAAAHRDGGVKARLFDWAVGVGLEAARRRAAGAAPGPWLAARHAVADRLVFAKIRDRFGGRMRYMVSGAAKLSADISEWFDAIGLPVLEGYGLTETSAGILVNRLDRPEHGTVGRPLPGSEVTLAADGEILVRGPGVMQGYHNLPEATAGTLVDGWLRTGDIGEVTARGALRVTDRKKDLIKTAGGKYVAPQHVESRFKAICPLVSTVVVHGEGRPYITALVDLDADAARAWAADNGLAGATHAEIARSPRLVRAIGERVEELNAGLGRWESVKRFRVLESTLTVEGGDLTPSMKLRRRAVEQRHAALLDALYDA
ncbi:AMP-dependent synthetase/ligase [Virgisporangium ochraceum]|uniref:AMP-dependent synthetase n=1 Tax=Virgisporangium ochraceum TaxID=65505 RepID=A0A8J3ZYT7_9ACTN|nr:long-chain fatty acid--CoA ligase [Virgisporangium ochraceum]GIJ72121.1 AMP-dependent synthetase [Virgisporangium ochraceum]